MNSWTAGFAVSTVSTLWLTTSPAAAQPPPPAQSMPAGASTSPATDPAAASPAATAGRAPMAEPALDSGRPTELALAIGVGYTFPTSLQTPNTTSVRVRLRSGVTFEPQLALASSTSDVQNGTATTTTKQSELTVASLVRYPLQVRNRVDFEAIGTAAISRQTNDPDGNDNNRTTTIANVGYGVGLAYWVTRHWNVSLTATNPLIAYTRSRQEMAINTANTNTTTTFGLVFDPTVALMLHLYD